MCKNIWTLITPEESIYVRSYERQVYYIRNIVLFNSVLSTLLYIIPDYIINIYFSPENITEYKTSYKYSWEIHDESRYKKTIGIQLICCSIGAITIIGTEAIVNFLVFMPCGYLKVLENRLSKISGAEENNTLNNIKKHNINEFTVSDLKMLVYFHQKIMKYCEEIEKLMRSFYFVSVFASVYNMSIIGMAMLADNAETTKFISLFILNMFQFFSFQWAPEYLLKSSSSIVNAAYFASFGKFHQQKKMNNLLFFMIIRAQKPAQMTAGGYTKLSIQTFGNMVRSAYTVFTLLRKVN